MLGTMPTLPEEHQKNVRTLVSRAIREWLRKIQNQLLNETERDKIITQAVQESKIGEKNMLSEIHDMYNNPQRYNLKFRKESIMQVARHIAKNLIDHPLNSTQPKGQLHEPSMTPVPASIPPNNGSSALTQGTGIVAPNSQPQVFVPRGNTAQPQAPAFPHAVAATPIPNPAFSVRPTVPAPRISFSRLFSLGGPEASQPSQVENVPTQAPAVETNAAELLLSLRNPRTYPIQTPALTAAQISAIQAGYNALGAQPSQVYESFVTSMAENFRVTKDAIWACVKKD
jgi:hypothetical protein